MGKRQWKVAKRWPRRKQGKEQATEHPSSPKSTFLHLPEKVLDKILSNLSFCGHHNQNKSRNQQRSSRAGSAFNINELSGLMLTNKWLRERCLELTFGCHNHPTIHLPYIETDEDRPSQYLSLPLLGKSAWRRLNLAVSMEWRNTSSELGYLAQLLGSMPSLQSLKLSVAIKSYETTTTETAQIKSLPNLRDWEPVLSKLYGLPLNTLGFHLSLDAMPEELIDPIHKAVINGIRADLMVARGNPWASDWGLKYFCGRNGDVPYQIQELRSRLSQMYSISCFRLPCWPCGENSFGPFDYYNNWNQSHLLGEIA